MPYASARSSARAIPRSAAAAGFDRARRGRRPVRAWRHGVRGRTSNLSTVGVTISTTRAAGRAEVNRDEVCSGERRRRQSFKCSVLRFPLTSGALGHHAAEEQRHWGAPPSGRITEGRRRRRDPEDAARYLSPFPRRRHRDAARWRWVQSHGGREGPRHVRHAPRSGFRDDPRGYDPPPPRARPLGRARSVPNPRTGSRLPSTPPARPCPAIRRGPAMRNPIPRRPCTRAAATATSSRGRS